MTEKEFRLLFNGVVEKSSGSYEDDAVETATLAGLVFEPELPPARTPPSEVARLQQERDAMIQRQFYQKLLVETAREMYVQESFLHAGNSTGGPLEVCVASAEALLRLCGLEEPGRTAQEPES